MDLPFPPSAMVSRLLEWYRQVKRPLPWRSTRDPYPIWVAEVVFQQTRIAQGMGHYLRFLDRFPDVRTLAGAKPEEVLKAWEGLGYYSRARNLHKGAGQVVHDLGGSFPETIEGWEAIAGVGPYIARAVVSSAFGVSTGVVDGNVLRVWSRLLDIPVPPSRSACQSWADQMAAAGDPGEVNNAMMELGAIVCTPAQPGCASCPLQSCCMAFQNGTVGLRPVKAPRKARPARYYRFYLSAHNHTIMIRQRPNKGLWGGLWEIPNEEIGQAEFTRLLLHPDTLGSFRHSLTHFELHGLVVSSGIPETMAGTDDRMIHLQDIPIFAFPKAVLHIFRQFLQVT